MHVRVPGAQPGLCLTSCQSVSRVLRRRCCCVPSSRGQLRVVAALLRRAGTLFCRAASTLSRVWLGRNLLARCDMWGERRGCCAWLHHDDNVAAILRWPAFSRLRDDRSGYGRDAEHTRAEPVVVGQRHWERDLWAVRRLAHSRLHGSDSAAPWQWLASSGWRDGRGARGHATKHTRAGTVVVGQRY